MARILVPIDGSEYAEKAMLKAKELAMATNSDMIILNVIRPVHDRRRIHNKEYYEEGERNLLVNSRELLENSLKHFDDFPGNVETLYKRGDTAEEIVEYAENEKIDLIIMGSRGQGAFSRTLIGSVSDKVIHHSNTSVLIVK